MAFVLRMVGRELRGAWRRLIFFFVCIAIGVGAIAAIRSVIDQVTGVLTREARAMTGADIVIQSTRPWDPATVAIVDEEARNARVRQQSHVVETATMLRVDDASGGDAAGRAARRRSSPIPCTAPSRWRTGGPTVMRSSPAMVCWCAPI